MTTVTIQNTALDAARNPLKKAWIRVTLVASTAGNSPGLTDGTSLGPPSTTQADNSGHWSIDLTPNTEITPSGTWYIVDEGGYRSTIVVPDSGGPYNLEQVVATITGPPGTPSPSIAYVDGQHADAIAQSEAFASSAVATEASLRSAGDTASLSSAQGYTDTQIASEAGARVAGDALALQKASNLSDVASAASSRQNLHAFSMVNVLDYGAVGDASFVDQTTVGNNWGLVGAVPLNSSTYGQCYKDSAFTTPATDNTGAFQQAWDALMNSGQTTFERIGNPGTNTGYRTLRKEFYIPEGAYYLASASALFSLLRVSISGSQTGVTIRGAGKYNTTIYVRITGTGSTDYLFYDSNSFNGMHIEGVSFYACTGSERFFYHAGTGNAKRYFISDSAFNDYSTCVTIGGSGNADRWTWVGADYSTRVAQATLFTDPGNTQAVNHEWFNPSIAHLAGGIVWNVGDATVHVFGGFSAIYGTVANGAAGILVQTGSLLSNQLYPQFAAYSHKTELHDDSGYVDIGGSKAVFYECNPGLTSNTRTAPHVVVRHKGSFAFHGGFMDDLTFASSTSLTSDYYSSDRNQIAIRNAVLANPNLMSSRYTRYSDAGDGLTTLIDLTSTYTGSSGIARITLDGCRAQGVNFTNALVVAPNGSPFSVRGYISEQLRPQVAYSSNSGNHTAGLPSTTTSPSPQIVIPLYCELRRVTISKQAGTGAGTWQVADGNSSVLCTLTASSGDTYVFSTAELRRQVNTTNDATFTITCTSGASAQGFFSVEYV